MAKWSSNKLTNGDAESGSTTGWATTNVVVVPGGVATDEATGSNWCFKIEAPTSSMQQTVNVSTQPPSIKLGWAWLAEEELPLETEVKAWIEVELEYADGSKDSIKAPLIC